MSRDRAEKHYDVVFNEPPIAFFRLDRFADAREAMFIRTLRGDNGAGAIRHDVRRGEFRGIVGSPLAYWAPAGIRQLFRELPPLQPTFAEVRQGLATADDSRFVRQHWEVPRERIGRGNAWVPFAKGGDFSRYYSNIDLILCWAKDGQEIKHFPSAVVRNEEDYFRAGLTWPRRTQLGFNLRMMPEGCIFGDKGPSIFPQEDELTGYLLGLGNSNLCEALLRVLMSFGSYEVGVLQKVPILRTGGKEEETIAGHAIAIHDRKAAWDTGDEVSTRFTKPWLLQGIEGNSNRDSLAVFLDECLDWEDRETTECRRLHGEIEEAVYELYAIVPEDRVLVEQELGERPKETVWPQMEGRPREQRRQEHVLRLLSYLVKIVVEEDADGIVPMVECDGEATLYRRVVAKLDSIFGEERSHQIEGEINNELGAKMDVARWLAREYFKYHVRLYKSRPIFWHLSSENGTFGAIVHYHRFSHDRLLKLRAHYVAGFLSRLRREAGEARKGAESRESRARLLELETQIEEVEAFDQRLEEILEGRIPVHVPWKSAGHQPKGWYPDLEDGVKVNILPFQKAGLLAYNKVVSLKESDE